jgi:hypothetical protein
MWKKFRGSGEVKQGKRFKGFINSFTDFFRFLFLLKSLK